MSKTSVVSFSKTELFKKKNKPLKSLAYPKVFIAELML